MRRGLALLPLAAALVAAAPAAGDLQPVRRQFGDVTVPRVRAWSDLPARKASGRVRVIAVLAQPPLAARARGTLAFGTGAARLDVRSSSSRAYLERLDAAQRAVAAPPVPTSSGSTPPSARSPRRSAARSPRRGSGAASRSCSTGSRSTCPRGGFPSS